MNLRRKKKLISRTLGVGVRRIKLDSDMRDEIKEAITRQDIKDLKKENIIKIKEKKGRKTKKKRKTKRRKGSIKKSLRRRKKEYVNITRKLREHIKNLKNKGELNKEKYNDLRKKIKSRYFKDFAHLRNYIREEKK
jgi:ribosomal protein L19E